MSENSRSTVCLLVIPAEESSSKDEPEELHIAKPDRVEDLHDPAFPGLSGNQRLEPDPADPGPRGLRGLCLCIIIVQELNVRRKWDKPLPPGSEEDRKHKPRLKP